MGPRPNSWKRKDGGAAEEKRIDGAADEDVAKGTHEQGKDQNNRKWEGNQEKQDGKQSTWGTKDADASADSGHPDGGTSHNSAKKTHGNISDQKLACEICGMFNHSTKECCRQFCENCGFANHSILECKKCLP